MTVPIITPCQSTCTPWATSSDMCSPCDDYATDSTLLTQCLQASSDILFELSGHRFAGICQDTVRPCAKSVAGDYGRPVGGFGFGAYGGSGFGYSGQGYFGGYGGFACSCNREQRTGCSSVSEITLGGFPVTSIVSVKVDGQTLAITQYRIDDNRYLVRLPNSDGTNPGWPCCQDMTKDSSQVGTWEVAFTYGLNPPTLGVRACSELACQLYLACQPELVGSCRLPQRVTQVTRQGVTAILLDPMAFLENGKTGLYSCDLFLSAYNPNKLKRRATIVSPDRKRRVRRTG